MIISGGPAIEFQQILDWNKVLWESTVGIGEETKRGRAVRLYHDFGMK